MTTTSFSQHSGQATYIRHHFVQGGRVLLGLLEEVINVRGDGIDNVVSGVERTTARPQSKTLHDKTAASRLPHQGSAEAQPSAGAEG